jgi:hypothetical protein
MKTLFSIMLIFLFISCSGGSKTPLDDDVAAVVPDSSKDIPDEDFADDDETDTEHYDDSDTPGNDPDIEPTPDPCEGEPCKSIENSTGKCFSYGKNGYACECKSSYVWFSSEQKCLPVTNFYGTVCTGQTKCYDMKQEIECPKEGGTFYGQDAQYAKAGKCVPRSYTIKQYDDGETVVDNNTGLEWQRGFVSGYNNDPGGSISFCKSLNLGGSGWRIPSPSEQCTIIDARYFNPVVDETYFPHTPPEFFYSSDYKIEAGFTYRNIYFGGLDFEYGTLKHYFATDRPSPFPDGGSYDEFESGYIRCVRSQREDASCTVRILTTNLTTDEYSIKLDLSKNLVIANVAEQGKNWSEALSYCENLTYAGISDWRLPNRNEMRFFALPDAPVWTSTTAPHDPAQAVVLNVDTYYAGDSYAEEPPLRVSFYPKESSVKTFCVASNPCGEGELWAGEKCVPFADLGIDDAGCECLPLYGWDPEKQQCVEQCSEELCKQAEHSNGECAFTDFFSPPKYYCQCEEGYFYDYEKCVESA